MNDLEGLTPEQIEKISKARERVIDSIGKNMDLYGITLSIGHLYGYMYFNQGPVTLDELSKTMGMSKTSMSTGVRTLLDLKMIDKVWGEGLAKTCLPLCLTGIRISVITSLLNGEKPSKEI